MSDETTERPVVKEPPLPEQWPKLAKSAVLHAVSLASAAFALYLGKWLNSVLLPPTIREREAAVRAKAQVSSGRVVCLATGKGQGPTRRQA